MSIARASLTNLPVSGLRSSVKSRLMARIAGSHDPLARLCSGRALELYYEAGDAHSQLCAALARRLLPRLRLPLRIRLVPAPEASTYPEQQRQRAFAEHDARRIAPCHGLSAPVALAPDQRDQLEARLAAVAHDTNAFLDTEGAALCILGAGHQLTAGFSADATTTRTLLRRNAARRRRLGHYLPAMWLYRGEWFWALDRLGFLHDRLVANSALDDPAPLSMLDATRLPDALPPPYAPLEFWFSFRSPYSYLAAVELLRRRADGLYAQLQVRPILPMVMRGLPVPLVKRLYIVRDAQRSADALRIPFGRMHDPVGDGVLRLLTVYPYASDVDTQLRYCAIAGQSIWAEGLDACRDDVLRSVVERSGLDWNAARNKLASGTDRREAEIHREALLAAGLWGVPSFRWGTFTSWGQDRLWMLDQLSAG